MVIDVLKAPSANITDVADRVKTRMQQIPSIKNGDVSLSVFLDREQDLNSSLNGLVREGLLGALFSMLCVFFFFRNVRSTLLIAISLPISLLATTGILKSMGITLNILTVSGLIVAMGRIVDDSIVILDNMYRKVQEGQGKEKLHLLASGVYEMIPAILASTLTTIAVYVPIAMAGGIVSATFAGFAWSVVIALIVSFFVAALVIPALGYLGWRNWTEKSVTLEPKMEPILRFAFARKKWVLALSVIIFVGASAYAATLPVNFLPNAKSGEVAIKLELPQGSPLSEVDTEVKKVEKALSSNPNVSAFSANFGSTGTPQSDDVFDEGGGYIQQPNVANMSVAIKDKRNLATFIQQLQTELPKLSSKVVYTVTNQNVAGDDSQVKIMLTGADQTVLNQAAGLITSKLIPIPGLSVDGKANVQNGLPKYKMTLDRNKVEAAGVKLDNIVEVIERYTAEPKDFSITVDRQAIPVDMQIDQLQSTNVSNKPVTISGDTVKDVLSSLAAETVPAKDGKSIRLDQLATISEDHSASTIRERDGQPYAVVSAQITSNDLSKVSDDVQHALDSLTLPKGVSYSLGGASEQVNQMILDMSMALAFSILLVLLIISSVFKGWRAPLAVLVSIPMALSGVVVSMAISHAEWNLAALIGVLMLSGIVVTNGIVLIDKIERNMGIGMEPREAIVRGSLSRVRPIFMTAGTTILTLIPLALTQSTDTVISQTLGIVVIGGMITSTLNSFVVIPIIYELLNKNLIEKNSNRSKDVIRIRTASN